MTTSRGTGPQQQLAVFIDFENIALGLQSSPRFDVRRVLDRLLEKGKVIAKIAYADWNRFREYTRDLHENGIELIEIPRRATSGKNSADIRLVVDAMDLAWSKEHIDTFVIVSGDSDFSPLVSKLKENGRHVIGLGMKASTSLLLANGCDEFIYYEDLEPDHDVDVVDTGSGNGDSRTRARGEKESCFRLLVETLRALEREGFDVMQASLVKDTMKRKRPAFSEAQLGYGSFQEMLEEAQEKGLVTLRKDERSGTYLVSLGKNAPGGGPRRRRASEPRPEARPRIDEAKPAPTRVPASPAPPPRDPTVGRREHGGAVTPGPSRGGGPAGRGIPAAPPARPARPVSPPPAPGTAEPEPQEVLPTGRRPRRGRRTAANGHR